MSASIDPFKKVDAPQIRAQAAESCRLDLNDNEYLAWVRAMMGTSDNAQKLAAHRVVVAARVIEMGNAGFIENMEQREAAIIAGMLPYVDPITTCDGIADHDAVKLRDRCVSRRSMVQYLELNANVRYRLRLHTGDPIEVEDMQLLHLNPEEYAFFNEELDIEPHEHEDDNNTQLELYDILTRNYGIDDDDDRERYAARNNDDNRQHDYDVIVALMRSKREEAMREHCTALLPSLIDPTITCEEFESIASQKVEMPFTLSMSEWEAFGFREVPVDEEFGDWNTGSPIAGFSDEAYLDLNEVTSNCGKLLAQIILAHYDGGVECTEESHDDFLDKIDYLLSDWGVSSGLSSSYKLYKHDLYAAVLFALEAFDGMLLKRLFQWTEETQYSTWEHHLEYDNNISTLRIKIHEAMDTYNDHVSDGAEEDDDSKQPINYTTVSTWVNKMVFDISEDNDW